jgi:glutaredoxin 3
MSEEKAMPKVTIYSTPTCHFCTLAKEFFTKEGVSFEDHNVVEDLEKRQEMLAISNQMGVPVIVIGDEFVVGFNEPVIRGLLGMND